jgi:adiponectin receptor
MNIWTHLIPFGVFLNLFIFELASQKYSLNGGIINLYIFSSILLFLFSSIFHSFSSHSNSTWNCCFKIDLLGIMIELISATICSLHFLFHDYEILRRNYIILFLVLGIITVILSMFDFFISDKFNILLTMLYSSLFALSFISAIHWVIIAKIDEVEKIGKYIIVGFAFMIIGFFFFLLNFLNVHFKDIKL